VYILLAIAIVIVGYVVFAFNKLVRLKVRAKNAWADIDVQLKRRWDLVPSLVTTVKTYAAHERNLLEEVTKARAGAMEAQALGKRGDAEKGLTSRLGRLLAVAENYPELKANENFMKLADQLAEVEDTLQNARRYYNAVVRDSNTMIQQFPHMLVAQTCGFRKMEYFQLDSESERSSVEVRME